MDLKGKYVMPGIINLHGHVGNVMGLVQDPKNYTRANTETQSEDLRLLRRHDRHQHGQRYRTRVPDPVRATRRAADLHTPVYGRQRIHRERLAIRRPLPE